MIPIPSDFVGSDPGKISIRFHNGVEVVDGSIVKQTGVRRYVVSDGVKEYVVQLARTLADVVNLTPGLATILVYPYIDGKIDDTPEHIHRIEMFVCYTVEGHRYGWRFKNPFEAGVGHSADQDGEANIATIPFPAQSG